MVKMLARATEAAIFAIARRFPHSIGAKRSGWIWNLQDWSMRTGYPEFHR